MHFDFPWAFLALLILPFLVWFRSSFGKRTAVSFSATQNASGSGRSLRQRLVATPLLLRLAVLVLLIVAIARPRKGMEPIRDVKEGIAIAMVVDRSPSMGVEMPYENETLTRLEVAKRVFREFVIGNDRDLKGRHNDLVGMVSFARYPDTVCPLTFSHAAISNFLDTVQLVTIRGEDGTAIGDGVSLAAARLKQAEDTIARQTGANRDSYDIKSKIIILLTDGMNNTGRRSPAQAAKLAAKWGIKIYAIGIGGDVVDPLQGGVDRKTLDYVAQSTGGIFRMAEDADSLRQIYREIDRLERARIEAPEYLDYREHFTAAALPAAVLMLIEVLLVCTIFRRTP